MLRKLLSQRLFLLSRVLEGTLHLRRAAAPLGPSIPLAEGVQSGKTDNMR